MRKEEKNIIKNLWIDWIQLFLIGLTAPFFLFPSMQYIWILFIVPGIWICRWIVNNRFFERTILDWAIVVLLIQVLSTCIVVPDVGFSLPKIAGVLLGLFFFYSIIGMLKTKKLIKWGILAFLIAGLILSIIGILGMQWDRADMYSNKIILKIEKTIPKINWNLPGAEEGFNSNAIGGTLIHIIPLCLIFFISHLNRKNETYFISTRLWPLIYFFLILFVTCSVLFLSLSIGSWIGLTASIWILLFPWKWKKWSLLSIILFIALIYMLDTGRTNAPSQNKYNNAFTVEESYSMSGIDLLPHGEFKSSTNSWAIYSEHSRLIMKQIIDNSKNGINKRKALWLAGINVIIQHPFFGIGMNRIRLIPSIGYKKAHVHNNLVQTAAELGIPGLIAYLAILFGAGFMCLEIWRKSDIAWMRITALGLGCGQLAHFIFGIGDSIPLGAKVGIFFWISLGLIAAMYNYMLKRDWDLVKGYEQS